MITTLIKHEWLRSRGLLGTVAGVASLVVVVATLLTATGWPVISFVGFVLGSAAVLALAPALQLALAADYWKSSYGRIGYFTQSLPIRGATIYAAKLSWAVLVTLAALVVTVLLVGVFWLGAAPQFGFGANPLTALSDAWAALTAVASPGLLVAGLLMLIVFYLMWPVQYYFAASVGSERPLNRHGFGGPVLVFVGLYMVSQLILVLGMIVVPFGIGVANGQVGLVPFNFAAEVTLGTNVDDVMPIGFVPPLVVIVALCLWRTVRSWNRRVSLA